jgi:hypothetical protein
MSNTENPFIKYTLLLNKRLTELKRQNPNDETEIKRIEGLMKKIIDIDAQAKVKAFEIANEITTKAESEKKSVAKELKSLLTSKPEYSGILEILANINDDSILELPEAKRSRTASYAIPVITTIGQGPAIYSSSATAQDPYGNGVNAVPTLATHPVTRANVTAEKGGKTRRRKNKRKRTKKMRKIRHSKKR